MKRTFMLLLILALILGFGSQGEAKWWIFGQSNEEVSFSYLYLNSVSYEESGPKVSVPKSSLQDGQLRINGKARVGKGKVGGVRISLDNRATWQDAKVADDGTFELLFRPELARMYVLFVEVIDTVGKSNDVEKTRKELTVIDSNAQQLVKSTLDELLAAYRSEDPARFMKLVSEDFTGDSTNLDRAIRKDFSAFDNIDLRYTFNNISIDPTGRAFAAITFSRSVTSSKSGKTLTDKGNTEFIFKMENGAAKVFSMKNPLIFGLSDPEDVATGTGQISDPQLLVDGSGNIALVPASLYRTLIASGDYRIVNNADGTSMISTAESSTIVNSSGQIVTQSAMASATVESQNNINVISNLHLGGFNFISGTVVADGSGSFNITGGEDHLRFYAWLNNSSGYIDLGAGSIASVTEAPASGYITDTSMGQYFYEGHSYAFRLSNGKYALMQVKVITSSWPVQPPIMSVRIDYKYQPSGSRLFLP